MIQPEEENITRQKRYGEELTARVIKTPQGEAGFCCVMHQHVSRGSRGNCTSSKSVSLNGPCSRRRLTALHPPPPPVFITEMHLYKSLSLPLSHKSRSSLTHGGYSSCGLRSHHLFSGFFHLFSKKTTSRFQDSYTFGISKFHTFPNPNFQASLQCFFSENM